MFFNRTSGNLTNWFIVATGSALIVTATVSGVYYCLYRKKKMSGVPPRKWKQVGQVTELCLYPLKSGKRINLKTGKCTEFGMQTLPGDGTIYQLRDRSFVIYKDADKEFRTARTYPKLMLIEVEAKDEIHITFKAPEMESMDIKIPNNESENTYIIIWDQEKVPVLDCGDEIATWISKYLLDKPSGLRMAFHQGIERRDLKVKRDEFLKAFPNLTSNDTGMFSDLGSYLLINQSSVDDLNGRLSEQISHRNFRPNILVSGPNAFDEDSWDWIKVGNVIFRNFKPCTRCTMTTINPDTGIRSKNREPLKTLESYRMPNKELQKVGEKSPMMGINLGVKEGGEINVGDPIFIGTD